MNSWQKSIFYFEIILILILFTGYLYKPLTVTFVSLIIFLYMMCFGAWHYFK